MANADEGVYAATVPLATGQGDLLACRECGLLKTPMQFEEEGCDNCEQGIGMGVDAIQDQCTPNFSGMIAIMDPAKSWCARWTRKRKYMPGLYALKLEDEDGH